MIPCEGYWWPSVNPWEFYETHDIWGNPLEECNPNLDSDKPLSPSSKT